MTQASLSKTLARYTRPLRVSLGLARTASRVDAGPPFRRSEGLSLPGGRIRAVEIDLDRLIAGWNQHLPQVLAVVSEARQDLEKSCRDRAELTELLDAVAALRSEVASLSNRLDAIQPEMAPRRPR